MRVRPSLDIRSTVAAHGSSGTQLQGTSQLYWWSISCIIQPVARVCSAYPCALRRAGCLSGADPPSITGASVNQVGAGLAFRLSRSHGYLSKAVRSMLSQPPVASLPCRHGHFPACDMQALLRLEPAQHQADLPSGRTSSWAPAHIATVNHPQSHRNERCADWHVQGYTYQGHRHIFKVVPGEFGSRLNDPRNGCVAKGCLATDLAVRFAPVCPKLCLPVLCTTLALDQDAETALHRALLPNIHQD